MKRTPLFFLLCLTLLSFSLFHFQTSNAKNESSVKSPKSAGANFKRQELLQSATAIDAKQFGASSANKDQDQKSDTTVITSYKNATSIPLREMKPRPEAPKTEHEANEDLKIPISHKDSPDPVVQDRFDLLTSIATPTMPSPILNFDGIPFPIVCNDCNAPDTNGEVGATQYVQIVNRGFQVFDKATGEPQLGPMGISMIWSDLHGLCETDGMGDPVVLYDQFANRWLISQLAGPMTETGRVPTDECIAVSINSDATGRYYQYAFHLNRNSQDPQFFDYPKLAVWPDAYYMAVKVYRSNAPQPPTYLGPQPFAFNRAMMLAGEPAATLITTGFNANTGSPNEDMYLPADLDGSNPPPPGTPARFIQWPNTDTFTYRVFYFHVDFADPSKSTFTPQVANPNPTTAFFTKRIRGIPQLGTTTKLNSLGDRLMFRADTRFFPDEHESLVGNFTVESNNVAAVRWFELRKTPKESFTLFQEGTYQPDTTHRWMGSVAMDQQGNLALGYSASSSGITPEIRYAGRFAGDPLNTLTQGEMTLFAGTGSENGNAWGDYSGMTIDPVDDCTFWYTQEYYASTSSLNWRTRIGSFRFPGCLTRTLTVASTNPSSGVSITVSPADNNGSGNGTTQLSRTYNNNTSVSLTAPATTGGNNFQKWQQNGVDWSTSQLTSVVMDGNYTMTAVYGPGTGVNVAAYDPILKAPTCGQPGSSCDSGTLLNGRGNISGGPEPNQPNTINNSCSDGSLGTYHVDESIDRIKVTTTDGSALAPGKLVTFEVTYWASSTASDFLDLYYLSDVSSSNWTYMTTLRPQATGLQVGTSVRQLAGTGNRQVVRAILRSGGSTALCSPGNLNDHDDLVFAAPAPPPTLMVESANPVSDVNITVSPNDNNGQGNGTTEFTRIYNYNTNVTLTAPATVNGNVFSRWRLNGFDLTTNLSASVNVVPSTTMTAVYVTPQHTLTVASTNPASGVSIAVNIISNNGAGNGTTPFSRPYNQNTTVTLAAPAKAGGNNFQKWQRNGVDWSISPDASVTLDADYTMTAVYVSDTTLKGYWKFDENTGTTATDSSGNGNTGTLNSGASWTSGQSGAAVSLDGVSGYVKIKDGKISTSTTGTISAWVKVNSLVNARKIVSYGGAAAASVEGLFALEIRQDGSHYYFSVIDVPSDGSPNANSVHGNTALQSGVWYHVAVTSDGSSWKLYVNGVAETLTTQLGSGNTGKWFGNTSAAAPDRTYIGGAWFNGTDTGFLNGVIDEVRIYDGALSASEIANLAGLGGYWKFDENTGTTAADVSGSGNTATLISGASWTTGQNGSAVSLDGVDDYVQVGAQSSLVMTNTGTLTTWIYPTGAGSNAFAGGTILAKEGEYVINRFPDGTIQWGFANGDPGWQFINTGYVAPLNQWTHIAITYDNGVIKTYANGSLVHTYSGSGFIGDQYPSQNDFRIGGRQLNPQLFQGRIDEVRVYNRALSAGEISWFLQ